MISASRRRIALRRASSRMMPQRFSLHRILKKSFLPLCRIVLRGVAAHRLSSSRSTVQRSTAHQAKSYRPTPHRIVAIIRLPRRYATLNATAPRHASSGFAAYRIAPFAIIFFPWRSASQHSMQRHNVRLLAVPPRSTTRHTAPIKRTLILPPPHGVSWRIAVRYITAHRITS